MTAKPRNVLDTLRIIDTHEVNSHSFEVCATANAAYEEGSGELTVELDSFVRGVEMEGKDRILHPLWLPRPDKVRSHVDRVEASLAAKEIFTSWVEKVRKSIPSLEDWRRDILWLKSSTSVV